MGFRDQGGELRGQVVGLRADLGVGPLDLAHKKQRPIRNRVPVSHKKQGPYCRPMPRAIWWSLGRGLFLMSEVPLYRVGG